MSVARGWGLIASAIFAANLGCRTISQPGHAASVRAATVTGIWEGLRRDTIAAAAGEPGDTRIERQAWQLLATGHDVRGFFVVELTLISGDGRPFLCSGTPRFTTLLRVELRGRLDASETRLVLQETGAARVRGPCRPSFRSPPGLSAALGGDTLTVTGGDRTQTLYRHPAGQPESGAEGLAAMVFDPPDRDATTFPDPGPAKTNARSPPLDGLAGEWTFETGARLPNGDQRTEREVWHLTDDAGVVTGFYDRTVELRSTDGQVFRCNGEPEFRVVTRYQIAGHAQGGSVVLYERGFKVLDGGPCDDGQRRLDAYEGTVTPEGLRLDFGVGHQTLRRASAVGGPPRR